MTLIALPSLIFPRPRILGLLSISSHEEAPSGHAFKDDEKTKDAVLDALEGFSLTFILECIAALRKRLEKCVTKDGDYAKNKQITFYASLSYLVFFLVGLRTF